MQDFLSLPWEAWTAIATGILALITGALAYFTYGLFSTTVRMQKTAEQNAAQQKQDVRDSLAVSKKAADAAVISQRAFIFATKVEFKQWPRVTSFDQSGEAIQPIWVEFTITNEGRTPASVTEVFGQAQVLADRQGQVGIHGTPYHRGNVLAAGKEQKFQDNSAVAFTDFQAAEVGRMHLYFLGLISYTDFLDEPHITRFCYVCDFPSQTWKLDLHPNWNDWD